MLSSRMLATHHAQRSLDAGLIPIPRSLPTCPRKPFRINTCKSVSKQMTLTPFRINTYEKHRGVGVLLLSTHPMRMRILSERSESKDLSLYPSKGVCPDRPSAVKDLSSHPARVAVLRSIARFVRPGWAYGATKDLSSHPTR